MPPKGKGKKGKKGQDDDDAFWEAKAAALDLKSPPAGDFDDAQPNKGGGAFDGLDDEEEGGGGLMSRIKASKKDKKKKKNAFADLEDDMDGGNDAGVDETRPNLDDEWPEDDVKPKGKKSKKSKAQKVVEEDEDEIDKDDPPVDGIEATRANLDDEWPEEDVKPKKGKKGKKSKAVKAEDDDDEMDGGAEKSGVQTPAEETRANLDDEWPEEDVKPKGKKGKKGKTQKDDDEEEEQLAPAAAPVAAEADAADDDGAPKILSKKEKEKLKKEKEKEKKKAQAAAKRAAAGDSAPAASPTVEATPEAATVEGAAEEDAEGDDVEGGDATAADKKKKKKKKPAAKAEPAPPPAAKGKKVPAHIAAMQAAMAEKQRLEEESRRAEEERQRKIEEEEAALAAEEARVQAQKDAKKAKEKEKRAQAKAEGRLLTPAQKREKAAAEARKQALLNAGVKIAGLQGDGAAAENKEKKKPVYQKKKGPAKAAEKPATPATPEPSSPVVEKTEAAPAVKDDEDEDDWDKSEDDAAAVEEVVKGVDKLKVEESEDDWDKSSEDEAPAAPPAPAPRATTKPEAVPAKTSAAETAPKAAPAPKSTPAAPPTAANGRPNGKPVAKPAVEEESSDEDDDEESSEEEDSSDESDSSIDSEDERRDRGAEKVLARRRAAEANKDTNELRSPICCILGHVDHGKTRLLDKIRQTSVAEGEAGGITQQIGATFFPADAIRSKSDIVNSENYEVKIPGLLIIDTPGHEAFANLRTRGSSLCNIAILVVDITQSFQPQTVESLNLLKKGKTPFIVALNKIDKLYGWQATPNNGFRDSLAKQSRSVKSEFEDRLREVKLRLSEQGLNSDLFDENKNLGRVVSLVPTSAFTGEGIPDMLLLLAKLTQERMNQSLMYISELSCTILEVKSIDGMGMTIDVILSNGHLKLGDTIVLCGTDGPIVTNVRALLTPQPLRELRIKSSFVHNPEVKAALGVKIFAPGLEKAIAGARLFVANDEDEVAYFKDIVMDDLSTLERFTTGAKGKGVYVQASTLGALEALLTFLQSNKVPVFDFGVGPVFSRTIRSHLLMLERAPEYACILAFDVPIDGDAKALADKEGLKIFTAPVIYHLFDAFQKYLGEVIEARKRDAMGDAVWPVRLSIIQAFAHRDPIILGCDIIEGSLRVNTPVGVVRYDKVKNSREIIKLGKITSLEKEHKSVNLVKKRDVGGGIAVKIERAPYETARLYGRHFDDKDEVVSLISRQSIDTLKNVFRDSVTMDEWKMIKQMKIEQGIA